MIKLGKYKLCILDLVTDKKLGGLDSSKIWQHIAFGIMSQAMLQVQNMTWQLIAAYGAVVGGSRVAIEIAKNFAPKIKGGSDVQSD